MADRGRRGEPVFFIYDHNMLKKEEDDLKDAILFFTPDTYSIEDQCALCGQLMGISEFLKATLSKSAPRIFRFEHEKFALKRTGAYSFGLKGGSFTPDSMLNTQLISLYRTFVTYHGSVDSLKLRCKESAIGFLQELNSIWRIILNVSQVFQGYTLSQTFQTVPYLHLPKSGTHLFLQATHLLQSSQRKPYVLAGTILYKNKVLSTQLPPTLTNHLTYLQNQIPHIVRKTAIDLPIGCRIVTVFLTDEELSEIEPPNSLSRQHCEVTDFSVFRESESSIIHSAKSSKQTRSTCTSKRRLTCPNLSVGKVAQKTLHSDLTNKQKGSDVFKQDLGSANTLPWSLRSKISLSHVPIVECKNGESANETDSEISYDRSQFGERYKQVPVSGNYDNEHSETDSDIGDVNDTDQVEETSYRNDNKDAGVPNKCVNANNDKINVKNVDDNSSLENCDISTNTGLTEDKGIEEKGDKVKSKNLDELSDQKDLSDFVDDKTGNVIGNKSKQEQNNILTKELNQAKLADNNNEDEVNPSISDFEEEDETPKENDNKFARRQKSAGISNSDEIKPAEIVKKEKVNFDKSIEISVEQKSESVVNKGVETSESSTEVPRSRFYDCLTDTETKILAKDSNRAIHEHTVAVHRQDTEIENVDRDTEKSRTNDIENDAGKLCECEVLSEAVLKPSVPDIVVENHASTELEEDCVKEIKGKQSDNGESKHMQSFEDGKENMHPNTLLRSRMLSESQRYESEIETEDESVTIATIEPCINCLELASQKTDKSGTVRCKDCIEKFNKRRMFPDFGDNQEIIDFQDGTRERYESGTETEGVADVEHKGPGHDGSQLSSFSSDISSDSTISRYWTSEMDGLNDLTLYVQCHSDISLLLLMEHPGHQKDTLFHSLWKGSLAYLADLDYQIKECIESVDDDDLDRKSIYLKYDMLTAHLKGTIEDPGTGRKGNNLHQMLASLHTEFQQDQCLSDVVLRSHFNSCYGHANQVEETFFQSDRCQNFASGFPVQKDPLFSLDDLAQQHLANEKHLSLL